MQTLPNLVVYLNSISSSFFLKKTFLGFRIRYKLHGAKDWTQVNTDLNNVHQHPHSVDGQQMGDINTSNAQQLSSSASNSMSNSISLLGNGFYSMPRQQEINLSNSNAQGIPTAININDLQPGRKYLIQVSGIYSLINLEVLN